MEAISDDGLFFDIMMIQSKCDRLIFLMPLMTLILAANIGFSQDTGIYNEKLVMQGVPTFMVADSIVNQNRQRWYDFFDTLRLAYDENHHSTYIDSLREHSPELYGISGDEQQELAIKAAQKEFNDEMTIVKEKHYGPVHESRDKAIRKVREKHGLSAMVNSSAPRYRPVEGAVDYTEEVRTWFIYFEKERASLE